MSALQSTMLHTIELTVCMAAAFIVLHFFGVNDSMKSTILGILVNTLAKFARSSDAVPVNDYINQSKD